jgi:hypothetical protein
MNLSSATRRGRQRPLTLALAAALLAVTAGGAVAQAGLGEPAPDFTRLGNDGIEYTLSDAFGAQVQLLHMVGYG